MSDNLGTRMKEQYENRVRYALPSRTYTLIRVDGKAFHTFTKRCKKPYDEGLVAALDYAGRVLCIEAQGIEMAYLQSDELSFLLTDFASEKTEAWFDGNIQKICSVAASVVTAAFNHHYQSSEARFDARVWTIPDPTEVENYFIWRQQDATRNSISMLAQHHFSHRELQGKSGPEMQEMLHSERGINWNDQPSAFKRGRTIIKDRDLTTGRDGWEVEPDIPIFTAPEGREWLRRRIPRYA